MKNLEKIKYSKTDQAKSLQSGLYYLCNQQPFFGALLQELNMQFSSQVPTAGITYNKHRDQFEIYINSDFFCPLSVEERVAVLHHEILHFTNKHLFRLPFIKASPEDRRLYNIAGDMAINQFIPNLPKGCVDVKGWKYKETDDSGASVEKSFPLFKSMEEYYELIKNNKELNKDTLGDYKEFDVHDWEELDEETKKQMLAEAKKVLTRTIEKTSKSYSTVSDSIKDLLEEIETSSASINYKQILRKILKRTVSSTDRESTWKRPNKRYGIVASGTKIGLLPKLNFYVDTSGSISHIELNEFLDIMSGFLKVGSRDCLLHLWHTEIYYKEKFKLNQHISKDDIESGGTAIVGVMEDIKKRTPNLSIILTDLYFDFPNLTTNSEILWIVSRGGNKNHNFPKNEKVIYLDGIDVK